MEERIETSVELEKDRLLLEVAGEDRASFLHGMLSNDVTGLGSGGGAAALLLTEQGRIVAQMNLLVLDDRILLDLTSGACERLRPALERFIVADDVEFEQESAVAVTLRGEGSRALLGNSIGEISELASGSHVVVPWGPGTVRVARVDDLGTPAYRLWCPDIGAAESLLAQLVDAGAMRLSLEAREALRLEAGVASEGVDFDESTLAPEVPSLAHAISNRKGCYLGQEVVERVASRGKVKWLVAPLVLDGPYAPGAQLQVADKTVGHLTSVARDSIDGKFAAIARVRREVFDGGEPMVVSTPEETGKAWPEPRPPRG